MIMTTQFMIVANHGTNMSKEKKDVIKAKGFAIQIYSGDIQNHHISLTDIAKCKSDEPNGAIRNRCVSKTMLSFRVCGGHYTIRILNLSNSMGLFKSKRVVMHLLLFLRNGLKNLM